ncbi:MAG TPA: MHYT domain-containing protein [Rhizomicrobium sp.]|nr:MHYT domain-containing protein [Rhizomicrobium sp.]
MLRVIDCIIGEHDLRLVLLAGVLCVFACTTAVSLIRRARISSGGARALWIAGAGFVAGSGIWATHFVGMLAYEPGIPFGFDLTLTIASCVIAIGLCTGGLALAVAGRFAWLGGAVSGAAIAVMHYVGMAGLRISADEVWNPEIAALSLVAGALLTTVAVTLAVRRRGLRSYFASSGLLRSPYAGCTSPAWLPWISTTIRQLRQPKAFWIRK